MKWLFDKNYPPLLPEKTTVDEACIWLLIVLDPKDKSRRFVASLLNYHFERGYLTENQINALQRLTSRTIKKFLDGELEILGAQPAKCQFLEFGKVIPLNGGDDCEVLE